MGEEAVAKGPRRPLDLTYVSEENKLKLQALEAKAKQLEEAFTKEEKLRKELEVSNFKMTNEMNDMRRQLDGEKGSLSEYMERASKLAAQKMDLESQLQVHNNIMSLLKIMKNFQTLFGKARYCIIIAHSLGLITRRRRRRQQSPK